MKTCTMFGVYQKIAGCVYWLAEDGSWIEWSLYARVFTSRESAETVAARYVGAEVA